MDWWTPCKLKENFRCCLPHQWERNVINISVSTICPSVLGLLANGQRDETEVRVGSWLAASQSAAPELSCVRRYTCDTVDASSDPAPLICFDHSISDSDYWGLGVEHLFRECFLEHSGTLALLTRFRETLSPEKWQLFLEMIQCTREYKMCS